MKRIWRWAFVLCLVGGFTLGAIPVLREGLANIEAAETEFDPLGFDGDYAHSLTWVECQAVRFAVALHLLPADGKLNEPSRRAHAAMGVVGLALLGVVMMRDASKTLRDG